MTKVLITCDGARVDEVELGPGTLTVGRKTENDIHIPEPTVSGHHARIVVSGSSAHVEDLDSTNGTYVNGSLITRRDLTAGDVITIGRYQLVYAPEASNTFDAPEPTRRLGREELHELLAGGGKAGGADSYAKPINWVAQDPDGTWWGFENKPFPTVQGWSESGRGRQIKLKQEPPNTDWRSTRHKV